MKRFIAYRVDASIFALFEYQPFFKRGWPCGSYYTTYKVGDVVYNKVEDNVGVVLGCIDEESEDLRLDTDGMVCYKDIEFYNPAKHPTARMSPELRALLNEIDKSRL